MADTLCVINFGSDDLIGLGSTDSNFIAVSTSNNRSLTYTTVLGSTGDEIMRDSNGHDLKNEVTTTYRYNAVTGLGAALPKIGDISNSYIITSISVESNNNDFPTITVTGHNHDTNAHDTVYYVCAVYSWPAAITTAITGAYGAYDYLSANLSVTDTETTIYAGVASSSVTCECDHVDIVNAVGDHLVGENNNGRISGTVTYNGAPQAVDTANKFHVNGPTTNRENTGFATSAYTFELGIAKDI
jgi:hypothetical protein